MKKVLIFFAVVFVVIIILSLTMTITRHVPLGEKVALIKINGVILDGANIIEELRGYVKDLSVKAIVIRVDSPGGAVAPSQEIYEEILKAKEKKKVVISMGSVAASGGYYISAPADRIVANAGTLTGSIGVIMEIPNMTGLMKKIGVETQIIKSGKHKDIASAFKSLTPEEREILQNVLDDVHSQFINAVSEGRSMEVDEIRKLSDGRIFTGRMAKELGLIDELGNLQDAINLAGELTGIEGEPQVITKEEKFSFIDMLKGKLAVTSFSDAMPGVQLKYLLTL